jgi:hypothetical protein
LIRERAAAPEPSRLKVVSGHFYDHAMRNLRACLLAIAVASCASGSWSARHRHENASAVDPHAPAIDMAPVEEISSACGVRAAIYNAIGVPGRAFRPVAVGGSSSGTRQAFDGNSCTPWRPTGHGPQQITADFGAPRAIAGIALFPSDPAAAFAATHVLETSDDGETFTALYTLHLLHAVPAHVTAFGQLERRATSPTPKRRADALAQSASGMQFDTEPAPPPPELAPPEWVSHPIHARYIRVRTIANAPVAWNEIVAFTFDVSPEATSVTLTGHGSCASDRDCVPEHRCYAVRCVQRAVTAEPEFPPVCFNRMRPGVVHEDGGPNRCICRSGTCGSYLRDGLSRIEIDEPLDWH